MTLSAIEAHLKAHGIFRMVPGLWAWNPKGLIPVHPDHDSAQGVYRALVASGDLSPISPPDPHHGKKGVSQ